MIKDMTPSSIMRWTCRPAALPSKPQEPMTNNAIRKIYRPGRANEFILEFIYIVTDWSISLTRKHTVKNTRERLIIRKLGISVKMGYIGTRHTYYTQLAKLSINDVISRIQS